MIFVTLGTQDKGFKRLLDAIEKEITNGQIKEEVVVQAGYTEYKSKNMKIFDLLPLADFNNYIKNCDILVTHCGVGSIIDGLKANKIVVGAARLKEYGEHTNNHQVQIRDKFASEGYILKLDNFADLGKILNQAKKFKPKKFKPNNEKMKKAITDFIKSDESRFNWFQLLAIAIIIILILIVL